MLTSPSSRTACCSTACCSASPDCLPSSSPRSSPPTTRRSSRPPLSSPGPRLPISVSIGFWNKLFPIGPDRTALYRAAAEAGLAASLVLFLYAFLRIGLWHIWIRTLFWCWIAVQFSLVFVAIVDPTFASGLARASTVAIASIGTALIAYLALRGQDRALAVIPSWLLLLVWLFGAAMIVL